MNKEPNITEPDKKSNLVSDIKTFASNALAWACMMSKTIIALIFIFNSISIGLYGFGLVNPSRYVSSVFGAISIAFAVVVLTTLVHAGVKSQPTTKRKK